MGQTLVNFRMDEDLKKDMERICQDLGMNMTTAFTIFARQVVDKHGIPFDVRLDTPNAETIKAMAEVDDMIKNGTGKKFNSVDELFEELNS